VVESRTLYWQGLIRRATRIALRSTNALFRVLRLRVERSVLGGGCPREQHGGTAPSDLLLTQLLTQHLTLYGAGLRRAPEPIDSPSEVIFVQHWAEELKAKLPAGK